MATPTFKTTAPHGFVTKPPDIGFSPNFAGNFIGGATVVPALNVGGFFSGGGNNGFNPNFRQHLGLAVVNVSKIIGNHTMKFGGEWASNTFESLYNNANSTYSAQQTGNPSNSLQPGSSLASLLLNVPRRRRLPECARDYPLWRGNEHLFPGFLEAHA